MKTSLLAVLALNWMVLFGHQSTFAQDANTQAGTTQGAQIDQDIDLLRKDIRSQKKQLIAANVPLTDAEAQKFWPVYDQYTAELVTIHNDKYQLIKEYAQSYDTMTDAKANQLATLVFDLENQRDALKKSYYEQFRTALGGIIAARWLQVENQLLMVVDLQIASSLPIVSSPNSN